MINRRSFGTIALSATLMAGVAAGALQLGGSDGPAPRPRVTRVETLDVTDLKNDRKLVGIADNVFAGTVTRQVGASTGDGPNEVLPETQFAVQVVKAIKGSLSGEVIVNQQGGFRSPKEKVLLEGDALVEPGRTYLFVTRTFPEKGWHTLVPVHGNRRIGNSEHGRALENRFRVAHAVQIPFDPAA